MLREISRNAGRKRRHQWIALAAFCCACATTGAADLKTYWEYKEAGDFARISEFLTGKEASGNRILLRSTPGEREGLYFSIRVKGGVQTLPEGAKALLEVLHPDSPDARTHTFDVPSTVKNYRELMLGLTGESWTSDEDKPLAWRVQILDADGKVVGSNKSYLWR